MFPVNNFGLKHFDIFYFLRKSKKCHFRTHITFIFEIKIASKPILKIPKENIEFKPFLRDLRCFSITFFHVCHQTFQKTEMCHTSTLRTFAFHPKVVSNPFSKIFSLKIIPTPTIISHRKDSPSHYQLENNDSLETCCRGIEINICKRLMTPVNSFQWNLNIAL